MKRYLLIVIFIYAMYLLGYAYYGYREQIKKDNEIISDCHLRGAYLKEVFHTNSLDFDKIYILYRNQRLDFRKENIEGVAWIELGLPFGRSNTDTIYFKDSKKTIKVYNFNVDTIIPSKKQSISCALKDVVVDGKQKDAIYGDISLD